MQISKFKVFVALFAVAFILNAEVTKNFAIICGTNGIGVKYSIYYKRIGADFGLPFYLEFDKNRRNDTLETKDIFSCNAYGTLNVIVYQRLLYDICLGISVFAKTSYEYNELSVDSTDLITSGLNLDFDWGPCFQYTSVVSRK
jgi:hypothetical protein